MTTFLFAFPRFLNLPRNILTKWGYSWYTYIADGKTGFLFNRSAIAQDSTKITNRPLIVREHYQGPGPNAGKAARG